MSRVLLPPFHVGRGAVKLSCEPLAVEWEATASRDILINQRLDPSTEVRLVVRASVTPGTLDVVLSPQERQAPPVALAIAVRSTTSRMRNFVELQASEGPGAYSGIVALQASDLYRELSLFPVLARRTDGPRGLGVAAHKGAILADGEIVK